MSSDKTIGIEHIDVSPTIDNRAIIYGPTISLLLEI